VASKGRILLLENIHPGAKAQLEQDGYEVELQAKALSEADLIKAGEGCIAVGIRSKTRVTKGALSALAPSLRSIGAFCIGTNQIDLQSALELGVAVFNAPFSNTRSVAELIIAEIVMLSRRLGDRSNEMHRGVWTKSAVGSYEIRGKTLGIIGYGHIGRQLGVLAESFGMQVVFYDVAARLPMGNNRSAQLDAVLRDADFVTLHVPETPQTKDMIGERELAQMKKGAFLLNASRGTVVVIAALAAALRSGHLGGAAIDVFPEEPEGNDGVFKNELQELGNVILTPHIGGSTSRSAGGHRRTRCRRALGKFLGLGDAPRAPSTSPTPICPSGARATHRIAHVHRNVPGVLRDVNKIVSDAQANVVGQVLATDTEIGYLVLDFDDFDPSRDRLSAQLVERLRSLETTISVRNLY
jgi:D-3-phosphoglycerate dehydrogenase